MTTTFWKATDKMDSLMDDLNDSEEWGWGDYNQAPQRGVYVLYENGKPIYVGRSNAMRRRIREHGADSSDRHSATFAFRLLRGCRQIDNGSFRASLFVVPAKAGTSPGSSYDSCFRRNDGAFDDMP